MALNLRALDVLTASGRSPVFASFLYDIPISVFEALITQLKAELLIFVFRETTFLIDFLVTIKV